MLFESTAAIREYLPELLKCVRLCLLERSYLVMEVGMEPLVRRCEVCRDLVDKAKDFLLLPERRSSMSGECPTVLFCRDSVCRLSHVAKKEDAGRRGAHCCRWMV